MSGEIHTQYMPTNHTIHNRHHRMKPPPPPRQRTYNQLHTAPPPPTTLKPYKSYNSYSTSKSPSISLFAQVQTLKAKCSQSSHNLYKQPSPTPYNTPRAVQRKHRKSETKLRQTYTNSECIQMPQKIKVIDTNHSTHALTMANLQKLHCSPRTPGSTHSRHSSHGSIGRGYTSRRSASRSSSIYSDYRGSVSKHKSHIMCICGRRMEYTQNPMNKYPPNAVLYCQQNGKCKKKITIAKDWFYCCKSRTSYHGTKDGKYKICYSCSISHVHKQERIRKNHQLLIRQLKNKHRGKVLITKDTKEYILSSTSANSKDETFRLLKETYFPESDKKVKDRERERVKSVIIALNQKKETTLFEGYMMKKGNFWNKSFKKRYFKLMSDKQLYYYKSFDNGCASDERGCADLSVINDMIKKGKNGLEIITPVREWKLLCNTSDEREEWYGAVMRVCMGKKGKGNLKKSKTFHNIYQ